MKRIFRLRLIMTCLTIIIFFFVIAKIFFYRTEYAELSTSITSYEERLHQLDARLSIVATNETPDLHASIPWVDSDTISAAQSLQTWALETLRQNNLSVRQYQPAAPLSDVDTPTISLRIEFNGALTDLVSFLAAVERNRPALAISDLQMRPLPQRDQQDGFTMVAVQMAVWGVLGVPDG